MSVYCGIDCGVRGAIVFYDADKDEINTIDAEEYTFEIKGKRQLNNLRFCEILREAQPYAIAIEQQIAMPKQSSVSTGTTMKNYGIMLGVITALKIPHHIVFSRTWMKYFFGNKKYTKELGYKYLSETRPEMALKMTTKRGRVLDGIVDATLIALWAERNNVVF